MKKQLSKDIIEEVSNELGVNPAFIEKDWYVVKLIKILSEKDFDGYKPIFSGGTSLSKGYGLIERFSEDLDFKIVGASSLNRDKRRNIREKFIASIKQAEDFQISDDNITIRNAGKNCCIYVKYPNNTEFLSFLRPYLQVELFFDDDNVPFEHRVIQSFVSQYTNNAPETSIDCILPFNTGADKFNALSWRIYNKDKSTDYTLLRHLHDLYAIRTYLEDRTAFKNRVIHNFDTKDKPRLHDENIQLQDIVLGALQLLETDKSFRKGYEDYVEAMSYATLPNRINFDEALNFYRELCNLF